MQYGNKYDFRRCFIHCIRINASGKRNHRGTKLQTVKDAKYLSLTISSDLL